MLLGAIYSASVSTKYASTTVSLLNYTPLSQVHTGHYRHSMGQRKHHRRLFFRRPIFWRHTCTVCMGFIRVRVCSVSCSRMFFYFPQTRHLDNPDCFRLFHIRTSSPKFSSVGSYWTCVNCVVAPGTTLSLHFSCRTSIYKSRLEYSRTWASLFVKTTKREWKIS